MDVPTIYATFEREAVSGNLLYDRIYGEICRLDILLGRNGYNSVRHLGVEILGEIAVRFKTEKSKKRYLWGLIQRETDVPVASLGDIERILEESIGLRPTKVEKRNLIYDVLKSRAHKDTSSGSVVQVNWTERVVIGQDYLYQGNNRFPF